MKAPPPSGSPAEMNTQYNGLVCFACVNFMDTSATHMRDVITRHVWPVMAIWLFPQLLVTETEL